MKINIAIDGPSAAGKSTIADILAERLGYTHLDTGAMYRAVAYDAFRKQIPLDDENRIVSMIEAMDLQMLPDGRVILDGEDVSDEIRTNEVSMGASDVSKLEGCRKALVAMQQKICEEGGYILDGRDIGTVVLKDAPVKIYLTASAEARAQRRVLQNQEKGLEADYEQILEDIRKRDYQDMHREFSPLTKAEDAIEIDTSDLNLEEVTDLVLKIIAEKTGD
ncbi:MAG: (d)CMP kinase [Erysipelotrichaceae bacterium]|nr:(d)CMP kinase [Erysipelotrichaceae bacterium]MBQ1533603.1 (d)CMP kinase [Erysipelotrichaceae bacterium]MBQ1788368.1 (d)CMP kinase [Erysipelotrichaceae bacterium]